MAEIVVDVSARLKVMQSSVADLQRVLDRLEPNSTGFKNLQKIISSINSDIDKLKIQTSKPFGSQNQFNQAGKTIDKLEESLARAKISIDRIKFSDLKLDKSQIAALDNFQNQLKDIKQDFLNFKDTLKSQFLADDFNKAFIDGFNPNLINKNFDEIVKNVNNRTDELGRKLATATKNLNELKNNLEIGEKIKNIPQEGLISEKGLGADTFNKFFQTNAKGVFSFKTGGGLKKGEIQQQFFEYLLEEFQLTSDQLKQLQNKKATEVRNILNSADFFNPQRTAASKAVGEENKVNNSFNEASRNYENALDVINRLNPLLDALNAKEEEQKNATEGVNRSLVEYKQNQANAARSSEEAEKATQGLNNAFENFRTQLEQTNAQWLNLQRQQATFNSIKSAIVNFMGFNQVLNITKRAVKEAANHIKELDATMNGIAIVTNMTTADLWNQVGAYSDIAQKYGTTIKGAYEVSKIYYQAGYETNDVLTLMNETLKLSKISGLDYATTTDYMMNAIRGFKMEVEDASTVVDVYSALAQNTAVSQQELAEAMSKTASSMQGVGSSFEDTSAMIATMVAVTRESANNIGSAMKSIASRYGELTKDPAKLMDSEGEAMSFNKVDAALKSVGISLQTTDHQFRNFTDVIMELSEVWDTLDSAQQRYIATQFAGNRQQNRFLALVGNKELLKQNMDVAAASEDAGTIQYLKTLDSLETKINQVQVAYQQFYTTIGAEGIWKAFLDGAKNVIETLNNLPKLFGKVPLGALTIIYDIISLIKTAALNGLAEIVTIWQNHLQKIEQTNVDTAPVGDKIIDGVVGGIKNRAAEVQEAFNNALDFKKGQKMVDRSNEYQSALDATDISMVGTISFEESDAKILSAELDDIISKMLHFGDISKETASVLKTALSAENYKEVATELEKITNKTREAGEQLKNTKSEGFFKDLSKNSKHLASDMNSFASALNMVGTLINTTSQGGKLASGALMGLSGAFRLGSIAVQAFNNTLNGIPWMAIATGVISIINGLSTAIETSAEKLERLTKEAENLNNEAKKAKAEYNTLQRSADKLDELKEKRYDSAEAAEEYQTAVDELAAQFPALIAGMDEAGNVILDTTNMESVLTEARRASAQATYEAALAEQKLQAEKLKTLSGNLKDIDYTTEGITVAKTTKAFFENSLLSNGDYTNFEDFLGSDTGLTAKMRGFNYALGSSDLSGEQIESIFGENIGEINGLIQTKDYEKALQLLIESYDNLDKEGQEFLNSFFEFIQEDVEGLKEINLPEITNEKSTIINSDYRESIQKAYEELRLLSQDPEATTQDLVDKYLELSNLIQEYEATIVEGDQIDPVIQAVIDSTNNGMAVLQEYIGTANALSGANKKAISGWRETNKVNERAWEVIDDNNNLLTLSNKAIDDYYQSAGNNQPIEQWLKDNVVALKDIDKKWADFGEKLQNENLLTTFNSMYEDFDSYNLQDFNTIFGPILENVDSEIIKIIIAHYNSLSEIIKERLTGKINTALENNNSSALRTLSHFINSTDLTIDDEKLINASIEQIQNLEKLGFSKQAQIIAGQTKLLISKAETLPPTLTNYYLDLINTNGFATQENIEASIQEIQNANDLTDIQKQYFIQPLEKIKEMIISNFGLSIATMLNDFAQDYDDFSKNFSKLSSGMSFKELNDFLDKTKSLDTDFDFSSEISQIGDKFILSAEGQQAYWDAYIATTDAQIESLNTSITQSKNTLNNLEGYYNTLKNLSTTELQEVSDSYQLSEDEKKLANELGILNDKNNYLESDLTGTVSLTATGIVALYQAIEQAGEDFDNLTYLRQAAEKMVNQQKDWDKGKYDTYIDEIAKEYNKTSKEIWEAIFNPSLINSETEPKLLNLAQQINSSYDALITDVLSKGFANINLANYKGLQNNGEGINLLSKSETAYQDFVKEYSTFAGKTIEETNALLVQAIEKDTQATTGAAAEAIKNLTWGNEKNGIGSLEDIQALADALQIPLQNILGSYNQALDQYTFNISDDIDLSQIDNFTEVVKDSVENFLKELTDNVIKGITGKLSNVDITTLKGQLSAIGLNDIKLDFTETVDGLKLSQRSAIELYNELKKIDGLQASLVFDELAKSLEASNENYQNISTILAHIADLQEKISKLEPGDARLEMYKNELAVAQEIAKVRSSTDNKDFNFMDRALPNGMQNPIDYWNATGEAYKAMNGAASSGYMEIQDFYNIVNEMSNMAQLSGQKLMFMGQEIDGSAEAAARLIEAGMSALTNVKGDGVKIALANFGADFETGAEAMKGNFDDGIKEMAKAQIQMLDSAIRMLEAMVAMEEIDENGDGTFGLDEIFEPDGDFKQNVTDWIQQLDTAAGGIEIGGQSLLEALQGLKPELVQSLLNDLANIDWKSGLDAYEQITAVLSKYFSGEEIVQKGPSIFELLEMPPKADENLEEFKQWCEKAKLSLKEGKALFNFLKEGNNLSIESSFFENLENLLELTGEQREAFKNFVKDDGKVTTEEIQQWSQISFKEEGKITDAKYTATDGSTLSLSNNPEQWQNEIAEYEQQIIIASHTGGEASSVDLEKSELATITLDSGVQVQGVVTAGDGEYIASYNGNSKSFKTPLGAKNWIRQQAEKELYGIGNRGGERLTTTSEGTIEVQTYFEITGKIDQKQAELLGSMTLDDIQKEIDKATENGEPLTINGITFDEGTTAEEVKNAFAEMANLDQLPQQIADGITQAFSGDGAAAIATALATAIQTALSGNEEQNIPAPAITLSPSSVIIDIGDNTPQLQTSTGSNKIPLGEVTGIAETGVVSEVTGGWHKASAEGEGEELIELPESLGEVQAKADKGNVTNVSDWHMEISSDEGEDNGIITVPESLNEIEANADKGTIATVPGWYLKKTDNEGNIKLTENLGDVDADASQIIIQALQGYAPENDEVTTLEFVSASGSVTTITITPTGGYETNNVSGEVTYKGTHKAKTDGEMTITPKTYSLNIKDAEGNTKTIQVPADVLLESSNYSDFYEQIQELIKPERKIINLVYNKEDNPENYEKTGVPGVTLGPAVPDDNGYSYWNPEAKLDQVETVELTSDVDATLDNIEINANQATVNGDLESGDGVEPSESTTNDIVPDDNGLSYYQSILAAGSGGGGKAEETETPDLSQLVTALIEVNTTASEAANAIDQGSTSAQMRLSSIADSLTAIGSSRASAVLMAIKNAVNGIRDTSGSINNVKNAINSLANASASISVAISVTVEGTGAKGNITGSLSGGRIGSISGVGNSKTFKIATAKGQNQALVSGRHRTLMGELGPELVVSNGRYFLVGQSGAEFVDLADDAIVFNHLQTQQLMKNGKSSRGKAVINEQSAISFAKGNTEGPALASAASALAELKRIRSMWQSMLNASARDLGSQAGGGSGGGGGGGGSGSQEWATVIKDYERWYNILRQIAVIEQEINQLEAERKNLVNGADYNRNLQRTLENYTAQANLTKELLELQEVYYNKRIDDFNDSVAKLIYHYDKELGTLQYNVGGLDLLARLQETDVNNNYKLSATEQLELIQDAMAQAGFDVAAEMKKITYNPEKPGEQYALKVDAQGRWTSAEKEESEAEKINAAIVEKFYEVIDSYVGELDTLHDEIADREKEYQELISKEMEIRKEYIENELKLEEEVLKAIEDREQKIIDGLEKSKDALQKANEKYIQGLSDSLQREQDMYNKNKDAQELSKLQRQLAILQRTGGSASEIRNLQEQIDNQLQDQYFQKQQEQIDAIQEASDKQIEAMEEQIDIMKESLEYQKENGLLYAEVREIMAQTPEQIVQFITENSKDWSSKSVLAKEEDLRELNKNVDLFVSSRENGAEGIAWEAFEKTRKNEYQDATWAAAGDNAKAAFIKKYNETGGNVEAAAEAAKNVLNATEPAKLQTDREEVAAPTDTRVDAITTQKIKQKDDNGTKMEIPSGSSIKIASYHEKDGKISELWIAYDGHSFHVPASAIQFDENAVRKLAAYKNGGIINQTGLAWVDGTAEHPEGILNSAQLKEFEALTSSNLSKNIENMQNNMLELVKSYAQTNQAIIDLVPSESGIVNIENFDFNMNVETIANDYDARMAGQTAFDEMIKIARKTTNRTLNRR